MATHPIIFEWIQKYGITSLLNTPCGGSDCDVFLQNGIKHILGVNLGSTSTLYHVDGDLVSWKPIGGPWDAAYVNCIFCTTATGDKKTIAQNMASWPIRHILIYDTFTDYRWQEDFIAAGWQILDAHQLDASVVEIWGRAA